MIRRQVGKEYWLISQHDHAIVSGELARHLGNRRFSPPSGEPALLGIRLHDCGWPLHDDSPTLNNRHEPLDVFESPRDITLPVWERSVEGAMAQDPYAGLLVSLHVLALSIFASQQKGQASRTWNLAEPRVRFEVNRFQHRMIEIQEELRQTLGLRTDRPLKNGLSEDASDPAEVKLISDFRLLQATDMLSLALCCTEPPFEGYPPLSLKMRRDSDDAVRVDPWPFAGPPLEVQIPFRRLPQQLYENAESLQAALKSSPIERFTAIVRPITI